MVADRDTLSPGRSTASGSVLIELMLSSALVVVALAHTVNLAVQSGKVRQANSEQQLAFTAARDMLEEIRALPLSEVPALNGVGFDIPGENGAPGGLRPQPGDADGLPGAITVTVDNTTLGHTLYRVRTSVLWTGVVGRRQVQLECLRTTR